MEKYLQETTLLDYSSEPIRELVEKRKWRELQAYDRIREIYLFVRDEILFGYNVDDRIPASRVLVDGYGQCNTKGILFMALLRSVGVPCRMHGFTIDKELQKGAMTGFVYKNAPVNVLHSWVEIFFEESWYELEAFILDKPYLNNLQRLNPSCTGAFCGYGVAVKDFQNPVVDWDRNNTYIQSEGINQDFGVYNSPDDLLKEHRQELSKPKAFLYRNVGRHLMNRNVRKIRETEDSRMDRKVIEKLIDRQKVSFLCSIDNKNYPNVKAMLKPRKREGLKVFYFSTNTSSMRVAQYRENPNASIYFYHKGLLRYKGVMLIGKMEVLTDQKSKDMLWKRGDFIFYKKGVTNPDYCVLKFTAESGRYYCDLKTESFQN